MESPQSSPTQPALQLDTTYYKARQPRYVSQKLHVVGTERGLRRWDKLPKKKSATGFKPNDQIEAHWMDQDGTAQLCKALILEIRELRGKGIRALQGQRTPLTLLLVAWFYDPSYARSLGAYLEETTLSSHIDVISIDAVKKLVRRDKCINIDSVLITHQMRRVPAAQVGWIPEQEPSLTGTVAVLPASAQGATTNHTDSYVRPDIDTLVMKTGWEPLPLLYSTLWD